MSSRSHAICTILILLPTVHTPRVSGEAGDASPSSTLLYQLDSTCLPSPEGGEESRETAAEADGSSRVVGQLMLVDLAGSERNYETTKMTAQQHKESAQINLSLMALKECFRAYHHNSTSGARPVRVPYRSSVLTRILRGCFTDPRSHRTAVVATLSPSPIDIQHTLNTLDHVVKMAPRLEKGIDSVTVEVPLYGSSAFGHLPVEKWSADQVQAWLGTVDGGRFSHLVVPVGLDGAKLVQLTDTSLSAMFAGQLRGARQEEEGSAWEIAQRRSRRLEEIGRALWSAVRREQRVAGN